MTENAALQVLLVEDSLVDAMRVEQALRRSAPDMELTILDGSDLMDIPDKLSTVDLVITDHYLPSGISNDVIATVRRHAPDVPLVVVSGAMTSARAEQLMASGATSCVSKSRLGSLSEMVAELSAGRKTSVRATEPDGYSLLQSLLTDSPLPNLLIDQHGAPVKPSGTTRDETWNGIWNNNKERLGDMLEELHGDQATAQVEVESDGNQYFVWLARIDQSEGDEPCFVATFIDVAAPTTENNPWLKVLRALTHDLANPLAAIMMQLELTDLSGLDENTQKRLKAIKSATVRMQSTVGVGLDMARNEARALQINRRPAPLGPLVDELEMAFGAAAERRGLTMELVCDRQGVWNIDRERVTQVIFNLVDNAIKYTPPPGHVRVEFRGGLGDGDQELIVTDTGVGISESELAELGTDFVRPSEARTGIMGNGIGLNHCRLLVDLHGGELTLASDGVDQGVTVNATFPEGRA